MLQWNWVFSKLEIWRFTEKLFCEVLGVEMICNIIFFDKSTFGLSKNQNPRNLIWILFLPCRYLSAVCVPIYLVKKSVVKEASHFRNQVDKKVVLFVTRIVRLFVMAVHIPHTWNTINGKRNLVLSWPFLEVKLWFHILYIWRQIICSKKQK